MSRIPAQGVVVTVGALSVVASLCLLGGGASAASASTGTTSHSLSLTATTSVFAGSIAGSAFGSTPMVGVSNAQAVVAASGAYSVMQEQVPTVPVVGTAGPVVSGVVAAAVAPVSTATPAATATPAPRPATKPIPKPVAKAAPVTPRSVAQVLAAKRGWTGAQWVCLDELWQHESKYQTTARNSRSGAYGIPQALPASKMATAGADWRTDPTTQVLWGLNYIAVRYGSPCGAWLHEERHGSY